MPLYRMAGGSQLPPPLPPHSANQRYLHNQHAYAQQQVVSIAANLSWCVWGGGIQQQELLVFGPMGMEEHFYMIVVLVHPLSTDPHENSRCMFFMYYTVVLDSNIKNSFQFSFFVLHLLIP